VDKFINGEPSFADQGSQGAPLELFPSAGDTEVTAIRMVKNSVSSAPVVEIKTGSLKSSDGIVSPYHGQLCHQTATFGYTSTSSVSLSRGRPSSLRASRQWRISSATSSGVSSGRGILCFLLRAKIPSIASRTLASASSRLSPWLTQPGKAGQWTEYPVSSGSKITVNFISPSTVRIA